MRMCRVKFCGIRSACEAELADHLGADAIGLLVGQLHRSNDFISPDLATEICGSVSPFVTTVLVTHLEDTGAIAELAQRVPCHVIQLHSDLEPAVIRELSRLLKPRKIIAKVSVEGEASIKRAISLRGSADCILLDTIDRATNRVGGTGKIHDWKISAQIAREAGVRIVLAGGLTPKNVTQAVSLVKPWAVDVNSGIESEDGQKSAELMRRFIAAARAVQ